jgi:glycosyltransferase involved in cell wall biosynthesis
LSAPKTPARRASQLQLLLVGPLPPPVGGTTVLFRQLSLELAAIPDIAVCTIDTSREPGVWRSLLQVARVTLQLLRFLSGCDVVSFHSSRRGAVLYAPIVYMLSRIYSKPFIFRGFGDFEGWYKVTGAWSRLLFRYALRASVILLETKSSVEHFRHITSRPVCWYPNSRPTACGAVPDARDNSIGLRFVFVGHVKPSKGIREIIEAAERVDGAVVDIYGPLLEGLRESDFAAKNARYCGILEPSAVARALRSYDILLLPTFYEGEGYPGIILEAYSQGLPVIATRWRSIPEIVNVENGILVEPRNSGELAAAMRDMLDSPDKVARLRIGALASAKLFSSERWTTHYADLVRKLHSSSIRPKGTHVGE